MVKHYFSDDQKTFIRKNIPGRSRKEMLHVFNERFGTDLTINQITAFIKNNRLSSGLDTRFKKGEGSWNKGMKGISFGGEETQFKKGNKPHNYKPVGTERVNGDGYVDIKIADPNKWRAKHLVIWENINGQIPKGCALIFGDGNRRNFDLNNLLLVSRKQLAILNQNKLIANDADLTKTGIIVADIIGKISEINKQKSK